MTVFQHFFLFLRVAGGEPLQTTPFKFSVQIISRQHRGLLAAAATAKACGCMCVGVHMLG